LSYFYIGGQSAPHVYDWIIQAFNSFVRTHHRKQETQSQH